ncbi:MAG: DUF2135 domain-containing protein [Planctomycetota bacterium]|nr:MAG: DUF2135 domain-containing protein [Planctomycetota bacterium]
MRKLITGIFILAVTFTTALLIATAEEPKKDKPEKKVEPPTVKITEPHGGWTSERIVTVKGTVSDQTIARLKLVVSGVPMTIRSSGGNFEAKLVLSPGSNCIQAIAKNKGGVGRDSTTIFAMVPRKDMKVTLTWDTDGTDIDMHITDPKKEECFYSHKETRMGGNLDVDITSGFGPETFTLANAERGKYLIEAKYYSSSGHAQTACRVDVILFEGTSKERRETHRFVLTRDNERKKVTEVFVR